MPIVRMPNGDLVRFPEGTSDQEIQSKITSKFPEAGRSTMGNILAGAEEGLAGDVVGAGQLAERGIDYLAPGTSAAFKKAHPSIASSASFLKSESMRPTTSTAEQLARIGGGALPIALLAPELGGAGWLARLAQAAFEGGLAGGVQPTQSGTVGSHLKGAAEGAAAGAALKGAGMAAPTVLGRAGGYGAGAALAAPIHVLAHHFGLPWWAVETALGRPTWSFASLIRNSALGQLAEQAGTMAGEGVRGATKAVPPEAIGAGVGQLSGEADDSGGRDVYVHARPQ
jgi:hypothetical protein